MGRSSNTPFFYNPGTFDPNRLIVSSDQNCDVSVTKFEHAGRDIFGLRTTRIKTTTRLFYVAKSIELFLFNLHTSFSGKDRQVSVILRKLKY